LPGFCGGRGLGAEAFEEIEELFARNWIEPGTRFVQNK
jgi:hypothetical protein